MQNNTCDNLNELKDKNDIVILLDSCTYSRIALREIISELMDYRQIIDFMCFTDYKLWRERNNDSASHYIIVNTSSSSLYGEDLSNILVYEKNRLSSDASTQTMLVLTDENRHDRYRNSLVAHLLIRNIKANNLLVVDKVKQLSKTKLKRLFRSFLFKRKNNISLSASKLEDFKTLTFCELRALVIISSGKSIKDAAEEYSLDIRTLYAQRRSALRKIAISLEQT